jgi:hypothetical protein
MSTLNKQSIHVTDEHMKNLALLISISLLAACGASDNSSSNSGLNSAPFPAETQDLKGSWHIPCDINEETYESTNGKETYSDSGIAFTATNYIDTYCMDKEFSMKYTASMNYAGEKVLDSGQTVKKVDAIIDTNNLLFLLHDEGLQAGYIADKTCNRSDWDSGEYINISNCRVFTDIIESMKKPLKSIYYIDGNQAYWGDEDRQSDEDGFPTELESAPNTKI